MLYYNLILYLIKFFIYLPFDFFFISSMNVSKQARECRIPSCDVMQLNSLGKYRRFRGICCLRVYG